jgi:hypothetical protein
MKTLARASAAIALAAALLISALPVAAADQARIRVVHASPDAPAVDVYVNDEIVDALTDVPFGAISGYLAVPAGDYNVKVYAAGSTTDPVIDADVMLAAGKSYTVAAINPVASIEAAVFVDEPMLAEDAAQVRVVHLSPDAPAVDVAPDGADPADAVVMGLEFPNATGYLSLPGGSYDLEVRLAGETTVALQLDPLALENGKAYSVFAIGSAAAEPLGGNALMALVALDGQMMPDTATTPASAAGADWLPLGLLAIGGFAALLLVLSRTRLAATRR